MSDHSQGPSGQRLTVRHPSMWLQCLKVNRGAARTPDKLAGAILMQASAVVLHGGVFKPGLKALGRMHGRSPRSIQRSVDALRHAGVIEVRRRGKGLSNVYRLAKWLWRRLTGRDGVPRPWVTARRAPQLELGLAIASAKARFEAARREVVLATN